MQVSQANAFWDLATQLLRAELPDLSFENWMKDLEFLSFEDGLLLLLAKNDLQRKMIEAHYLRQVRVSLEKFIGSKVEIRLLLPAELAQESQPARQNAPQKRIAPFPMLNPRYSFSSFVIGSSNRFAHAAALAVAESQLGQAYNPLFLYSGVGLGKTHLMHAVGHALLEKNPGLNALYISSETFTNELIGAITKNTNNDFRERFRSVDLLMVDDIQFIAGKEQTQEEFFHTFNALYESGKQIILSSDKKPRDIPTLEERLRSRFEWGLIVDIAKPDLETRIAILRKKAEIEGIEVPDEVNALIATRVESNIRELEGTLNRVIAFSRLGKREIDLETAQLALQEMFLIKDPRRLTMDLILAMTAEFFNSSVADLKSKKRNREISLPRHVAMSLCREINGASLPRIGAEFGGRDHSTVMHAIAKVEEAVRADRSFAKTVDDLRNKILDS
ncbi:MAG: chromosomal replication initiator protein DnaA [Christensenellaceae bacterium]|jgi:chromosomal replication initiator protein|nr:chromosomal replication initiator protein DnaA [Christensenellaceae bacterium]